MGVSFFTSSSDEPGPLHLRASSAHALLARFGYSFEHDTGDMPARELAERIGAWLDSIPRGPRWRREGISIGPEPVETSHPRWAEILLRMAEGAGDDGVISFYRCDGARRPSRPRRAP